MNPLLSRGIGTRVTRPASASAVGTWIGTVTKLDGVLAYVNIPDVGGPDLNHGPMRCPVGTTVGVEVAVTSLSGAVDEYVAVAILA